MSYIIDFSDRALSDIEKFEKTGNKSSLKKLNSLLTELEKHPTTGTGKPEQLKHFDLPTWSRRINQKHRLIYRIDDNIVTILVLSAWGHYDDK